MTEYDQAIITKTFRYMGAITYKFEKACELGVKCLFDIFNHGESFLINQAIIITRDFLRKCNNSKSRELLKIINIDFAKKINIPESRSALLYILGEYASEIKTSLEIITWYSVNFQNENEKVKAQILNAALKIFVIKPNDSEELVKCILEKSGEECENPDLRDRAYIYWRLLENDPDAAKEMLLGEKPKFIYKDEEMFEKSLLDDLIENLTNISSLYQKKSTEMIAAEDLILESQNTDDKEDEVDKKEETNKNVNGVNEKDIKQKKKKTNRNKIIESKINTNDFDLLGLGDSSNNPTTISSNPNIYSLNIMDLFGNANNNNPDQSTIDNIMLNNEIICQNNNKFNNKDLIHIPYNLDNLKTNNQNSQLNDVFSDIQFFDDEENSDNNIFSKLTGVTQPKPYRALEKDDRGKNGVYGLSVSGLFHRENQSLYLGLHLENHFHLVMNSFSFLISKNIFGLTILPENNRHVGEFFLNSENKKNLILKINIADNNKKEMNTEIKGHLMMDVFIKNNLDDFYIRIPIYFNALNLLNGKMSNQN